MKKNWRIYCCVVLMVLCGLSCSVCAEGEGVSVYQLAAEVDGSPVVNMIEVPLAGQTIVVELTALDGQDEAINPALLSWRLDLPEETEAVALIQNKLTITPAAPEGDYTVTATLGDSYADVTFNLFRQMQQAEEILLLQDGERAPDRQVVLTPQEVPFRAEFTAVVLDQYGLEMERAPIEADLVPGDFDWDGTTLQIGASAAAGDQITLRAGSGGIDAEATVAVACLEIQWPELVQAQQPVYGDAWSDIITLKDGRVQVEGELVPGRFVLQGAQERPRAGRAEYTVRFEPEQTRYGAPTRGGAVEVLPRAAQLAWSGDTGLTYTGGPACVEAEVANLLPGDRCAVTVEDGQAIDAGTYVARAAALDNDNYRLDQGVQRPYEIQPAEVPEPKGSTLTYNGAEQTGVGAGPGYEVGGGSARDAGEYTAQAHLADGKNYRWSDGWPEEVRMVPWAIRPADYTVSVADGAGSLPTYQVAGVGTERPGGTWKLYLDQGLTVPADQGWLEGLGQGRYPLYWSYQTDNPNYDGAEKNGLTAVDIQAEQPQVVTLRTPLSMIYGDAPQVLAAAVTDGAGEPIADHGALAWRSSNPDVLEVSQAGAVQIRGCGSAVVTVCAARVRGRYAPGEGTLEVTVYPRTAQLTWSGGEPPLSYTGTPAQVTARVGNLAPGDRCVVTVEGGREVQVGAYAARAVALSNPNYILPQQTQFAYEIEKGTRTLSAGTQQVVLVGEERVTLAPAFQDVDGGAQVGFASLDTRTASVSAGGTVAGVADGQTSVVLTLPETEHYLPARLEIPVQVVKRPILDLWVDGGALLARVDGGGVYLSGLGEWGEQVRLVPLLAPGVQGETAYSVTLEPGSGQTIAVYVAGRQVAYPVDTSRVRQSQSGVQYESRTEVRVGEGIAQQDRDEMLALLNHPDTRAVGLTAATAAEADRLLEQLEGRQPERVTLCAVLNLTAEKYDEMAPIWTLALSAAVEAWERNPDGSRTLLASRAVERTDGPVTLSLRLPEGFPVERLYTRQGDGTAYRPADVEQGCVKLSVDELGQVTLLPVPFVKEVTFCLTDGSRQTRTLDAGWIGSALPVQSGPGGRFAGWAGQADAVEAEYAGVLTLEQLERLSRQEGEVCLFPVFTERDPVPSGGGGGGGTGGQAAAVYTIAASAGEGGTISPTCQVKAGGSAEFVMTPQPGWKILTLLVDGQEVAAAARYRFEQVERDHTIFVQFAQEEGACLCAAFRDLDREAWYHPGVEYALERGLFRGTGADTFSPELPVTRGMLATVLYRLAGSPEGGGPAPFLDVPEDCYYARAVNWAWAAGAVSGYSPTAFAGEEAVTREQLALILYRIAGQPAQDWDPSPLEGYTDAGDAAPYGIQAMEWAVSGGLISGVERDKLAPQGLVTRAQLATVLFRLENG